MALTRDSLGSGVTSLAAITLFYLPRVPRSSDVVGGTGGCSPLTSTR